MTERAKLTGAVSLAYHLAAVAKLTSERDEAQSRAAIVEANSSQLRKRVSELEARVAELEEEARLADALLDVLRGEP